MIKRETVVSLLAGLLVGACGIAPVVAGDGFGFGAAQGQAAGGGTVSTTGDGLSGDGSSGDPLALAAVLEAIVDGGGTATAGAGTVLDLTSTGEVLLGDAGLRRAAAGILATTTASGTVGGALRVGTATDAAAAGDLSAGVTGSHRFFFDQSAADAAFTGASAAFWLRINATVPIMHWDETDAGADAKRWEMRVNSSQWSLGCLTDNEATLNNAIVVSRSGATPTAANFAVPLVPAADNTYALGGAGSGWSKLYMEVGIDTTAGDAATINAPAGRFRKDATGVTFTLTNSTVTANSIVICSFVTADLTALSVGAVAGSGSVVFTFNAAPTGNTDVNYWVIGND